MAAGAAAAVGATGFAGMRRAGGAAPDPMPLPNTDVAASRQPERVVLRTETLPALVAGEQAIMYAGLGLIALGGALTYVSNPYAGVYSTPSSSVGVSLSVPTGTLITAVDFCLYGSPRDGFAVVLRFLPDTVGYDAVVAQSALTGTGAQVVSTTVGEVFDGSQAYAAYHTSGTSINVLRAIRLRFIPPAQGFVAVAPKRVYDSRLNMTPDANGALASGSNRTISCANGRDITTGAIDTTNVVPSTATSIAYTLTVANTVAAGYIAVNPGGTSTVSASTINWSQSAQFLANTTIVKLGPNRTVTVIAGGGGTADFIIDIVGYFQG